VAANVEAPPGLPGGTPNTDRTDRTDADVLQSVLDRLRQEAEAGSATPPQPRVQPQPQPEPQLAARTPDRATYRPAQVGPDQRLGLARSALLSGNVDAARQYLEEAQLQLVFHPTTPYSDDATETSRVARDVASALSMLGAGDSNGALAYLDRALAGVRRASERASRYYGYAGAYGGTQSGQ
jgi:hypothetical protein